MGAVSLIVWTLTAMLVVKYALIVLRADDNGQGGTFALYSLLKRAGQYRSRAGDLQLTRSAAAPLLLQTRDEKDGLHLLQQQCCIASAAGVTAAACTVGRGTCMLLVCAATSRWTCPAMLEHALNAAQALQPAAGTPSLGLLARPQS